ncbi:CRISPR-associated endonuclease Cas2 [Thermosulfurimonas dismutans]|uniref:CRISPR-associated endoribonuclease Cas2 n=1 Tax=Thermosulfurimonas dismutans TaxID=999894 RepID=A0A179D2U2_9BACT|nr:CRISPR-associated endonuclease Cas2 [Thermosulfurimonas dismutans]OAQ19792.1 CRISPR-associated protein Cas2 [Thermosulfurimonas dismutans]
MFVILVYDAGAKRVQKFHKICRKYLNWVQLSVFEGELTEVQLERLLAELREVMNSEEDSVIVYGFRTRRYFVRRVIGRKKDDPDRRFW